MNLRVIFCKHLSLFRLWQRKRMPLSVIPLQLKRFFFLIQVFFSKKNWTLKFCFWREEGKENKKGCSYNAQLMCNLCNASVDWRARASFFMTISLILEFSNPFLLSWSFKAQISDFFTRYLFNSCSFSSISYLETSLTQSISWRICTNWIISCCRCVWLQVVSLALLLAF